MTAIFRSLLAALLFAAAGAQAAATEAGGVHFEAQSAVDGHTLVLNGAGVRTRFMFEVYAMGLYLPEMHTDAQRALAPSGAKRVRIVLLRDLGTEQFISALEEGLRKNNAESELDRLAPSIAAFRTAMTEIPSAPKGTEITIDWIPGRGTRLALKGKQLGQDLPESAFYAALLKIWLGERPADARLKRALLAAGR